MVSIGIAGSLSAGIARLGDRFVPRRWYAFLIFHGHPFLKESSLAVLGSVAGRVSGRITRRVRFRGGVRDGASGNRSGDRA